VRVATEYVLAVVIDLGVCSDVENLEGPALIHPYRDLSGDSVQGSFWMPRAARLSLTLTQFIAGVQAEPQCLVLWRFGKWVLDGGPL
jgi:hypothetical protein